MSVQSKRTLFAFDCDSTLVDFGLVALIQNLIGELTPELNAIRETFAKTWMTNWLECNNEIFRYVHSKGIRRQDFPKVANKVPWAPGMLELLNGLRDARSVDCIIVTDNNQFWIDCLLEALSAGDFFQDTFCAQVKWKDNGTLEILGYAPPTGCPYSTTSMCKGDVVLDYAARKGCYDRICYVGDGENDLCPAMRLSAKDMVYVREGYNLQKILQENGVKLKAPVLYWSSGKQILTDFYESMGVM